ncbi:MAG: type I secretion system permease/ATPase [Betaproteobacteria bacterium]|jgi:ATP-binding cassette subfamily C exporter for protease/lipase
MSASPSLISPCRADAPPDVPASVRTSSPAPQRELLRTLALFRREFIIVGLLSAAVNLLMLTPTIYMLQVYDRVMVSQNALTLIAVSLITLALFGLMAFAEWARSRLLVQTGVRIDEQLSTRVFNAAFESHLAGMSEPGRGPGRAFSDLLQVRQFITGNGVFAFFDLPWVPIYIAVMFLLHPLLGWVSIAFALLQSSLTWFGHRRSLEPTEAAQTAQTDETLYVQGKLRNAEVLESMGMVANLQKLWWKRHQATLDAHGHAQSISHRVTALSKFVRYVQQAASLAVGALLVIRGELSPGAMIAANVLMTRALAPIDLMVATWKGFITAREAFKRLTRLLDSHPERDPALQRTRPAGALVLKQVVATAPGRRDPILKGVDLQLEPGTVLVVLGPSGSGKSTLSRVILGIWGDVSGQVLLDGRPIESWDRTELGPHVGYLPQDIELFEGSIAENIARFSEVDSATVIAAAQAAGLHDMILRFPKGYDTPMGEAGSLLSGGQRQRVALARALYGEPSLVVLDEPNANLDDVGEAALARAVLALKKKGSTVVLVTHRPGAIAVADRLMVLRDGVVQIQGPRDEVLAALRPAAAQAPGAAPPAPTAAPAA